MSEESNHSTIHQEAVALTSIEETRRLFKSLSVITGPAYSASDDTLVNSASALLSSNFSGSWFYLQTRSKELEILGIDSIAKFQANSVLESTELFNLIIDELKKHPCSDQLFLLGGTSFDGTTPSGLWCDFSGAYFFLPRHIKIRRGKVIEEFFITNQKNSEEQFKFYLDSNSKRVSDWSQTSRYRSLTTQFFWDSHRPSYPQWESLVRSALDSINSSKLRKVVLARESTVMLDPIDKASTIFRSFLSFDDRACHFAFAPEAKSKNCFFGATPELLFSLEGKDLFSEAVAGTIFENKEVVVKGNSNLDQKVLSEHQYVVSAMYDKLRPISDQIAIEPKPVLIPFHEIQHLVTPIKATLKSQPSTIDLISLLHPTPAVCGTPTIEAMEFIKKHEPFDRGWYAGTIGFIQGARAEIYVSIRSGLIKEDRLFAYVGAGIVTGSVPQEEWNELNLKQRRIELSLKEER